MSNLLQELRRRSVLRVGTAYLVFGWLVLQFVDVVFPMLGLDDEVLGRPILIVLLIGLPITLILAWVFELTPDGLKRDSEVDPQTPVTATKGRILDRAIIVILVCAVGLLLADRFAIFGAPENRPTISVAEVGKSVAVMPFINQSSRSEDAFFADGLTEALLHILAQTPDLKVPARSSVFAYQNTNVDVREIGSSLGVDTVLEGSVRRAGDRIRITAQLIQASSGFTLWSKTFDRTMDDIFAVQDEIATSVSDALQTTLLGEAKPDLRGIGTKNVFAYEKYLQGLEQKNIASYGSLQLAEGLFKEALSADPGFTEAKIDLALSYQLQAETGLKSQDDAARQARALLGQVLDDDPSNARALAHSAIIEWQQAITTFGPTDAKTEEALAKLRDIVNQAPNVASLYGAIAIAIATARDGDTAEILDWIEKGLQVDPLSARLNLQKGRLLLNFLDRPEAAEKAFEKARLSAPDWTALDLASGDAAFIRGDFVTGFQRYKDAMLKDPQDHEIPAMIGRQLYNLGITDLADDMLDRAEALAPDAPFTQGLRLEKLLHAGNDERVASLATKLLAEDIEDRGSAFSLSVFGYVSAMINLDNAENVPIFFESLRPGISDMNYASSIGQKEFSMRYGLVYALNDIGDYRRSQDILEDITAWADNAAPEWRNNDYVVATTLLASGDFEGATKLAVQDLSQPLGKQKSWRVNYLYLSWVQPLLEDPKVMEQIERLKAESASVADDINAVFADVS